MRAGPSGVIFAMWLVLSTMGPAVATGQQTTAKEQSPQGNEAKGAASTSEAAGVRTPLARPRSWKSLAGDFLTDQKDIWASPKRIRPTDAEWLIPFAGVTAGLIRTDRTFSAHLKQEPATIQHYRHLADVSVAARGGRGDVLLERCIAQRAPARNGFSFGCGGCKQPRRRGNAETGDTKGAAVPRHGNGKFLGRRFIVPIGACRGSVVHCWSNRARISGAAAETAVVWIGDAGELFAREVSRSFSVGRGCG